MTQASTVKAIKAMGRELTVRVTNGEYRISFAIAAIQMANEDMTYKAAQALNEDMAYYTADASDALHTARSMHSWYVDCPSYLKRAATLHFDRA